MAGFQHVCGEKGVEKEKGKGREGDEKRWKERGGKGKGKKEGKATTLVRIFSDFKSW